MKRDLNFWLALLFGCLLLICVAYFAAQFCGAEIDQASQRIEDSP